MSRMSMGQEENDIYIIPPNFIDTGTIFGGTIKLRNAVEALILALLIGVPVFQLPVTLTTKLLLSALPFSQQVCLPSSVSAEKAFLPLSLISLCI